MRKVFLLSLFLTLLFGLTSVPVFADILQYEFDGVMPGGTITALGGGQFSGSGIDIGDLMVTDVTTSTLADFYLVSGSGPGGDGTLDFNTLSQVLTITGDETSLMGSDPASSGLLLSSTSFSISGLTGCTPGDLVCDISFSGVSNLGNFTGYTESSVPGAPGTWIPNSNDALATTPEPGSLVLLGSGLAFAGRFLRRRPAQK